ncbi:MAG: hypothetical protein WBL25_21315 [Anaerolineales bacterium]
MDATTRTNLDNIRSKDKQLQNKAYFYLLESTGKPVDWAYEAWDELVEGLNHKDNYVRAISSQVLANLAKSDPEKRILKDFDALLSVTKDERFVTARHTMQSIWKVGLGGKEQRQVLVKGLERRFQECITEKNCTLIRYDIIQGLRNLYDAVGNEKVKEKAPDLIETEDD